MLFISKLFHEDSVPVILAHNYLPLRLTTEPYTPADLDRPVYDFLEQFSRHRLAYYLSEIILVNADATMAAWSCRSTVARHCFLLTKPATTTIASRS